MATARRKDPSAWLRGKFAGLTKGQELALRDADRRDADLPKASAVAYMLQRGAFKDWQPLRLGGDSEGSMRIDLVIERLPWNLSAPARVVALELRELVYHYNKTKRGRGAFAGSTWDVLATERVPHWDYDGVDPLIGREPWERAQAENMLDWQAAHRERDADITWQLDHLCNELEAIESLMAEGNAAPDPAEFIASYREGD